MHSIHSWHCHLFIKKSIYSWHLHLFIIQSIHSWHWHLFTMQSINSWHWHLFIMQSIKSWHWHLFIMLSIIRKTELHKLEKHFPSNTLFHRYSALARTCVLCLWGCEVPEGSSSVCKNDGRVSSDVQLHTATATSLILRTVKTFAELFWFKKCDNRFKIIEQWP